MSEPARLAAADAEYLGKNSIVTDLALIWKTAFGAGRGDAAHRS